MLDEDLIMINYWCFLAAKWYEAALKEQNHNETDTWSVYE